MEPTTEWVTSIRTMSSKLVHVVYQIILLAKFFICSFPLNKGMLTCLALPSSLALWTLTNTHLKLGMKWEGHAHWPGTGISTPAITRTSWQTAGETNLMVVSNKHLWKKKVKLQITFYYSTVNLYLLQVKWGHLVRMHLEMIFSICFSQWLGSRFWALYP